MNRETFARNLQASKRVVIKVGTTTVTREDGQLNLDRLEDLAREVMALRAKGKQVIIVTSGAVGAGCARLGRHHRPSTVREKQAAAAVGQALLMREYERIFSRHGQVVAQILLTREDVTDRKRYLNARNTILLLLDMEIVPVINENDTLASEEIRFGDNDTLSALVAALTDADLLILLSDIDGFYTGDPRSDPSARLVPVVTELSPQVWGWAGRTQSAYGIGGMITKLKAAAIAMKSGTFLAIASGAEKNVCQRLIAGEPLGTLFVPAPKRLSKRQQWLAFGTRAKGKIIVDEGAQRAIVGNGKSLLPRGILGAQGHFTEGAVVSVVNVDGVEIARGIVNYSSGDIKRIAGRKSSEIEEVLGYKYADEVIHRNNMTLSQTCEEEGHRP